MSRLQNKPAGAASRFLLVTVLMVALGTAGSPIARAQEEAPVTDLTDTELTTELLVDALRPQVAKPPGARSLTPPSCAKYRKETSRGIRPAPVSEDVAITVVFSSDSAELTPEARQALDKVGAALRDPLLEDCCFRVEGHTDSQNTEGYNQRLSEARAESVVDYLVERFGVERDRLLQEGFGEKDPLDTNETPQGRQKNRRVQVSNLGYQTVEGGP